MYCGLQMEIDKDKHYC